MNDNRRTWLLALAALVPATVAAAATLTVLVDQTQVRKRPQFYAPAVATVHLGDRLEAEAAEGGWYPVAVSDKKGFIHGSAVTAKALKLSSDKSIGTSGTTAEEITLAGKGFNDEVEQTYKTQHPEANFAAVDAMEKRVVADEELVSFLKDGGLLPASAEDKQ